MRNTLVWTGARRDRVGLFRPERHRGGRTNAYSDGDVGSPNLAENAGKAMVHTVGMKKKVTTDPPSPHRLLTA